MQELTKSLIHFLKNQPFVVVSTIDDKNRIHCSAKGIADIEETGDIYIIDLYKTITFNNIKRNPTISITAIDEKSFMGYSLKGKAYIADKKDIRKDIIKKWEEKVVNRISKRLIDNVKIDRKSTHHPEVKFPHPEYMIVMKVEDIVDLTPTHLKSSGNK